MIDCNNFIDTTLAKLESLACGQALDIRSFKRNRKVVITKTADGYDVLEDGFVKETFCALSLEALTKLLRTLEKREFPRSNKLRFYILSNTDESTNRANYRLDEANILTPAYDPTFPVRLRCDYSYYDKLRHTITSQGGVIEEMDFTHDVTLIVRLEEPLYQALSQLVWLSLTRI